MKIQMYIQNTVLYRKFRYNRKSVSREKATRIELVDARLCVCLLVCVRACMCVFVTHLAALSDM